MSSRPGRSLVALLLLACALYACDTNPLDVEIVDGVVINPAEPDRFYSVSEAWRIGSLAEGPDAFGSIEGIGIAEAGEVVVADGQAGRLLLFSASGDFVRTIGSPGPGPDEFGQLVVGGVNLGRPWGMGVGPNGPRLLQFDMQGELVANWSLTLPDGRWMTPNAVDSTAASSGWITRATEYPGFEAAEIGERVVGEEHFIAITEAGRVGDTLLSVRGRDLVKMSGGEGSGGRMFDPRRFSRVDPEGAVVVGSGDEYMFHVIDLDADTLLSVRRMVPRIAIGDSERSEIRRTVRQFYVERGYSLDRLDDELARLMPVADTMPSILSAAPARGGGFWVRRGDIGDPVGIAVERSYGRDAATPPVQFDYIDANGRYVASWRPPEGFVPMLWHYDAVVGVVRDDFDVQYAVRIEFTPHGN